MRVLLSVPSLAREFGGPIDVGRGLQGRLATLGVDARIVGAGRDGSGDAIAVRAIARFHGTPIPLSLHRVVSAARHSDIVHVFGYRDPVGTTAAIAAAAFHVPYVVEPVGMHRRRLRSLGLKALYDRTLGRRVIGGARLVVATSAVEARELARDGVPPARVVVRANGLDLDAVASLPPRGGFRARLGLDDSTPLVLSLGRITRKKGLEELVEALVQVPVANLAIVGPDDGDGTLAAVARAIGDQGMASRVHVIPTGLWRADKLQALVDADVFCLFSMTENFGVAPAEAVACGTATIVSDRCGVAEWLGDGVAVVPYGDIAKLAATIAGLLADPERRRRLGERGRAAARALSWDVVARRQLEIYHQILDAR